MTSILRSFLVALGFKVDTVGLGRYNAAVNKTTSVTQNLGRTALWAATAVVASVALIARQLEKLYFSSLKTDDSVTNLKAFAFGMGAAGIASEKAIGMVEQFSLLLQQDPSKLPLLRALGVQANTATAQLDELIVRLQRMPNFYQRVAYAEMFGISADDLRTLERTTADRAKAEKEFRDVTKQYGVDFDKAAKNAHEFDRALASVHGRFQGISTLFAAEMMPALTEWLREFSKVLDNLAMLINIWAGKDEAGKAAAPGDGTAEPKKGGAAAVAAFLNNKLMDDFRGPNGEDNFFTRGGLLGMDWKRLAYDAAPNKANFERTFGAPPDVNVKVEVHTRDPQTEVVVTGAGREPLGQDTARNVTGVSR